MITRCRRWWHLVTSDPRTVNHRPKHYKAQSRVVRPARTFGIRNFHIEVWPHLREWVVSLEARGRLYIWDQTGFRKVGG